MNINQASMPKNVRLIHIVILLGLILALPASKAFSKPYQLSVAGSRLSADFQNVPLSTVMADIGAKTGIQFIFMGGNSGYNNPFSFSFDSLPIRTALEKLLSNFNYSLISDGGDQIRKVFILGLKKAPGSLLRTQPSSILAEAIIAGGQEAPAVNPPVQEGMQVTPGAGMQIGPGEGMQVAPGEGMQIGPGEGGSTPEGMQISPPGESGPPQGMAIGAPDEGPPAGMEIGPSGGEGVNPGSPNMETMGSNPSGSRTMNTGTTVRKQGR